MLLSLHSASQSVTGMNQRAKFKVHWPGIKGGIQNIRDSCYDFNCTALTQAKLPSFEPTILSTPFEALACYYFLFKGWYYFVAADRSHVENKFFEFNRKHQNRDRLHYTLH